MKSIQNLLVFSFCAVTLWGFQAKQQSATQVGASCTEYCVSCNTSTGVCSQCKPGFNLVNQECTCPDTATLISDTCVTCDIANCASCSSLGFCGTCNTGFSKNADGDSCISCNVQNCAQCSTTNTCIQCSPGFEFSTDGSTCLNCSAFTGCKTCSSTNNCTQCLDGFYQIDNFTQCVLCPQPCLTCSATGQCITCNEHHSLEADGNGDCFTCNVSNCARCSQQNRSICLTCNSQYILNSNSECVFNCDSYLCLECQNSQRTCSKCLAGYAVSSTTCLKCTGAPQCVTCNANALSTCTQCLTGFYISNGVCTACPYENCATCNATMCLTFRLETLQFAFTNQSEFIVPARCAEGCRRCSTVNPEYCYDCLGGFALTDGICVHCENDCASCTPTDRKTCLSCFENAYLLNGVCNQCNASSNCLTCDRTNTSKCESCPYGLKRVNGVCEDSCGNNCLLCNQTADSVVCTYCRPGFVVNTDGRCVPCYPNCLICSASEVSFCLACGTGFYLNSSMMCAPCASFSSNCLTCSDLGCTACAQGYFLNSSLLCTQVCDVPCGTCNPANASDCYTCLAGYEYKAGYGCLELNDTCGGICNVCPYGKVLNGIECTACTANCGKCMITDLSNCTSCKIGYYLSDGTCLECPDGCKTCTSATRCLSCNNSYTLEFPDIQFRQHLCVQCLYPCLTCFGNKYSCTSCVSGYYFNGWKCVATFNYGILVVLETNLTNFYTNYYDFLQSLAEPLQTENINVVSVYSISNNPLNNDYDNVQVLANLSSLVAAGTDSASTQYTNIVSGISELGVLGGMTVLSTQISVNGGEIPQEFNLGLVLGLVIPLAMLFIGGLIYFICASMDSEPVPVESSYVQVSRNRDHSSLTYELKEQI